MLAVGSWDARAGSPRQQMASYPPAASQATTLGDTKIPIGWVDFCSRYRSECDVTALPSRDVQMTPQLWKTLVTINARVNAAIEPVSDMDHWGVAERWDFAEDGKGDCEDYVLVKRRALIAAGLPRQALLVTIVRDKKDEGHAVLTVKTDRGDFILDNQEDRILPWTATGYRFTKRQAQDNPNRWVDLQGGPAPSATAAR
ncbi:transglutaminase-like cysteine peptidase [Terrirubrum flagellatum]|uniref:transglutaminase-like cysteine peptidase n=1 Tax=Terrirubrum flagellatum TaxID=2895980 RepID=UPI003CC83268